MDMMRIWPILVQFGVGGLMCAVGLWAGWRSGYLDMALPGDRRLVVIVVAGFVGLLALAAAFTFWLPFLGEGAMP